MANNVTVHPGCDPDAFGGILLNLRPEDQHEFAAMGADPLELPWEWVEQAGTEAWTFFYKGQPTFVWGTTEVLPGVRGLWGWGTRHTRRVIPEATRWGRRWWLPKAFGNGRTRRIEVRVPASSQHSLAWLQSIGMRVECALHHLSVTGEPMLQLSYTKTDYEREYVHFQGSENSAGPH